MNFRYLRSKKRYLALTLVLLCILMLLVYENRQLSRPASPHIATRPFINTHNNIHLFQTFSYETPDPTKIASFYDFVWGARREQLETYRKSNPHIILSYYIAFHGDSGTFDDPMLWEKHDLRFWTTQHPDWVLYQCDRRTPAIDDVGQSSASITFDFTNPDVIDWQIKTYLEPASKAGYDALAVDNMTLQNLNGACGFYHDGEWIQRYTGEANDPQWRRDIASWVTQIQAAAHRLSHPLALVPNLSLGDIPQNDGAVKDILAHIDGMVDEKGFTGYGQDYASGEQWQQITQFMQSVQKQGKAYFQINQFKTQTISEDQIEWALASFLMGKEDQASIFISLSQQYGKDLRYPAYSAKIGHALSTMYPGDNIYWRDYSGALIAVNPSATTSYTVTTSGSGYIDLNGHPVNKTFVLGPHSGKILIIPQ